MKKLLIAVGAPLIVFAAGSAWATTDSGGSVTSTGSSTTSTATSGSSTSLSQMHQPRATVWQHLSPVTMATVNPQHSTQYTARALEKQHRRHPIGMQRHPGAVQASEHDTRTDPRTGKTVAQTSNSATSATE